ncbi:MAG: TPM domain-containing protein [Paracoccaceae bacterium]|nr:MAG: TPM domain-containing protein [Paracoccaceae bacterium]
MRWLAILCLVLLPAMAPAQTVPPPLSDTVNDYADVLPPEVEARLTTGLQAARDETGVHVVVVIIERRAAYGGSDRLDAFAKAWFNSWGIGDATRNDGILILVATQDREVRIALGAGYPAVYDGRAQRVIDTAMLPAFRQDRIAEGVEAGVDSAIERLARPFKDGLQVTESEGFPEDSDLPLYLFLATFAGLTAFRFRRGLGDLAVRMRRCPSCGARRMERERTVTRQPTTAAKGEAEEHTRCRSCGHDRVRIYPVSMRSTSRGSGSSGGFGGGRSSGGGASGRW